MILLLNDTMVGAAESVGEKRGLKSELFIVGSLTLPNAASKNILLPLLLPL